MHSLKWIHISYLRKWRFQYIWNWGISSSPSWRYLDKQKVFKQPHAKQISTEDNTFSTSLKDFGTPQKKTGQLCLRWLWHCRIRKHRRCALGQKQLADNIATTLPLAADCSVPRFSRHSWRMQWFGQTIHTNEKKRPQVALDDVHPL